jgi:imidazolonepropionase-like amidohydrolase
VRIEQGTDAGVYPHGENAAEFDHMAADGMTPAQSLLAGTSVAAELLGLADIVAVAGNPLKDIRVTGLKYPAFLPISYS